MRLELGKFHNQYIEVTGEFMKLATTNNCCNLLFRNIMHEGVEITDHVWVSMKNVRNKNKVNEIKLNKHVVYKMRGKVYIYKKRSKESKGMVYDFGIKSVRIELMEV